MNKNRIVISEKSNEFKTQLLYNIKNDLTSIDQWNERKKAQRNKNWNKRGDNITNPTEIKMVTL